MTISTYQGSFTIKHLKVVEFKSSSYNNGNIHFTNDKVATFYGFFKAKGNNLNSPSQSCD